MGEKKGHTYASPDLSKLQAVEIDSKTTIYIALDANPEEAKKHYLHKANPGTINVPDDNF